MKTKQFSMSWVIVIGNILPVVSVEANSRVTFEGINTSNEMQGLKKSKVLIAQFFQRTNKSLWAKWPPSLMCHSINL